MKAPKPYPTDAAYSLMRGLEERLAEVHREWAEKARDAGATGLVGTYERKATDHTCAAHRLAIIDAATKGGA